MVIKLEVKQKAGFLWSVFVGQIGEQGEETTSKIVWFVFNDVAVWVNENVAQLNKDDDKFLKHRPWNNDTIMNKSAHFIMFYDQIWWLKSLAIERI